MTLKIIVIVDKHYTIPSATPIAFTVEKDGQHGTLALTNRLKQDISNPLDLNQGNQVELIGEWETDYKTKRPIPIFYAESLRKLASVQQQ